LTKTIKPKASADGFSPTHPPRISYFIKGIRIDFVSGNDKFQDAKEGLSLGFIPIETAPFSVVSIKSTHLIVELQRHRLFRHLRGVPFTDGRDTELTGV
jgi:hypothetical protein